MDLVWIYTYTYFSGDDADEHVSKQIDAMVEDRGNSQAAEILHMNLLEVHSNMWHWVKDKLTTVLVMMLEVPASTKYHYQFSIFLDPRYVMDLKGINNFNQSENVDTKKIVQQMMPKFCDYIMVV